MGTESRQAPLEHNAQGDIEMIYNTDDDLGNPDEGNLMDSIPSNVDPLPSLLNHLQTVRVGCSGHG